MNASAVQPPIGGPAPMSYEQLLQRLELASAGPDRFRGESGEGSGSLFGGLVAAQACVAAGRSVASDRALHALHGFFLLPGRYGPELRFEVEATRDGRSFSTRRVRALQEGELIFELSASFKTPEVGIAHQLPAPAAPPPEGCERVEMLRARFLGVPPRDRAPMDLRICEPIPSVPDPEREPRQRLWLRFLGAAPADPVLRSGLLVYASDRMLLSTASLPHGIWWRRGRAASLDHSFWVHGALDAESLSGWLLYACESPVARDALGLCVGAFYTEEGRRIASVAQQGLLRYRDGSPRNPEKDASPWG